MPRCEVCGFVGIDLSRHLKFFHQMSTIDYKNKYNLPVIDASVEEKRKETCDKVHGNPNYKNENAKKLSNEIYEGGHALSDPLIREKADQTKLKLYGNKNFTNHEQAKQTCIDRYGVDNVAKLSAVSEKKKNTLMERYGRIFNYDHIPLLTKEELIDLHINKGLSLREIGNRYGTTGEGIGYWAKKYNVQIIKKVTLPRSKEYRSHINIVKSYLEECSIKNKILNFSEFGKLTEDKKSQRLKRLFNSGKPYHHLLQELQEVALKPDIWPDFLKKFEKGEE